MKIEEYGEFDLGRCGENLAKDIEIDVSELKSQWNNCTIQLWHRRCGEDIPYNTGATVTGNILVWNITDVDTSIPGRGAAEIRVMRGNVLAKTKTVPTFVHKSITGNDPSTPPAVIDRFVTSINNSIDSALADYRENMDADLETNRLEIIQTISRMSSGLRRGVVPNRVNSSTGATEVTLGDIHEGGYYLLTITWTVTDIGNVPYTPSYLIVENMARDTAQYEAGANIKQTVGRTIDGVLQPEYTRRTNSTGAWTSWVKVGDNKCIEATGDYRDRSEDIMAMLTNFKVCHLGAGDFYVSGITMPSGSSIIGSGSATRIVLRPAVTDGYTIKMKTNCMVENVGLYGGLTTRALSSLNSNVGTRHGILIEGNFNTSTGSTSDTTYYPTISNVWLNNFDGGGIVCRSTGNGFTSSFNAMNIWARYCDAGIYIPYASEFGRFTNVNASYCYYGIINNGGNNMFVNCTLCGNRVGFLIDNANNTLYNEAHGSLIGGKIHHGYDAAGTTLNSGIGIKLVGVRYGYLFNGTHCGEEVICKDSKGVVFSGCRFGYDSINILDSGFAQFDGCSIQSDATISVTGSATCALSDCYTPDGSVKTIG